MPAENHNTGAEWAQSMLTSNGLTELAHTPGREAVHEGYNYREMLESFLPSLRSSISEDDSLSDASSYGSTDSGLSHPPRKWGKKKKKRVARLSDKKPNDITANSPRAASEYQLGQQRAEPGGTTDEATPRPTFMAISNTQSERRDRYDSSAGSRGGPHAPRIVSEREQMPPPDDDRTPRPTYMISPDGSEVKQQPPREKRRDPRVNFKIDPTRVDPKLLSRPRSADGVAPRSRNVVVPYHEENSQGAPVAERDPRHAPPEPRMRKAARRTSESKREQDAHIYGLSPWRSRIPVRRKVEYGSSASEDSGHGGTASERHGSKTVRRTGQVVGLYGSSLEDMDGFEVW